MCSRAAILPLTSTRTYTYCSPLHTIMSPKTIISPNRNLPYTNDPAQLRQVDPNRAATDLSVSQAVILRDTTPSMAEIADSRIFRDIEVLQYPGATNTLGGKTFVPHEAEKPILQCHLDALTAPEAPWRVGQVKEVDIGFCAGYEGEVQDAVKLVTLVAPHLQILRLHDSDDEPKENEDPAKLQYIARFLDQLECEFPVLRVADFTIRGPRIQWLGYFLRDSAKRLRSLRLRFLSSTIDAERIGMVTEQIRAVQNDLLLESIDMTPDTKEMKDLLVALASRAPKLDKLGIHTGQRHTAAPQTIPLDDPALNLFTSTQALVDLTIPATYLGPLCKITASKPLASLKNLEVEWSDADLKARDEKDNDYDGEMAAELLPHAPALRTCLFRGRVDRERDTPGRPKSTGVCDTKLHKLTIQMLHRHALRTSFASTPIFESVKLVVVRRPKVYNIFASTFARRGWIYVNRFTRPDGNGGTDVFATVKDRKLFVDDFDLHCFGVFNGRAVSPETLNYMHVNEYPADYRAKLSQHSQGGPGQLEDFSWKRLKNLEPYPIPTPAPPSS